MSGQSESPNVKERRNTAQELQLKLDRRRSAGEQVFDLDTCPELAPRVREADTPSSSSGFTQPTFRSGWNFTPQVEVKEAPKKWRNGALVTAGQTADEHQAIPGTSEFGQLKKKWESRRDSDQLGFAGKQQERVGFYESECQALQREMKKSKSEEEALQQSIGRQEEAEEQLLARESVLQHHHEEKLQELADRSRQELHEEAATNKARINDEQATWTLQATARENALQDAHEARLQETTSQYEKRCQELQEAVTSNEARFKDEQAALASSLEDKEKLAHEARINEIIRIELQEAASASETRFQTEQALLSLSLERSQEEIVIMKEQRTILQEQLHVQEISMNEFVGMEEQIMFNEQEQQKTHDEQVAEYERRCHDLQEAATANEARFKDEQVKLLVLLEEGERRLHDDREASLEQALHYETRCQELQEAAKANEIRFQDQQGRLTATFQEEKTAQHQFYEFTLKEQEAQFESRCQELQEAAKRNEARFKDEQVKLTMTFEETQNAQQDAHQEALKEQVRQHEQRCHDLQEAATATEARFRDEKAISQFALEQAQEEIRAQKAVLQENLCVQEADQREFADHEQGFKIDELEQQLVAKDRELQNVHQTSLQEMAAQYEQSRQALQEAAIANEANFKGEHARLTAAFEEIKEAQQKAHDEVLAEQALEFERRWRERDEAATASEATFKEEHASLISSLEQKEAHLQDAHEAALHLQSIQHERRGRELQEVATAHEAKFKDEQVKLIALLEEREKELQDAHEIALKEAEKFQEEQAKVTAALEREQHLIMDVEIKDKMLQDLERAHAEKCAELEMRLEAQEEQMKAARLHNLRTKVAGQRVSRLSEGRTNPPVRLRMVPGDYWCCRSMEVDWLDASGKEHTWSSWKDQFSGYYECEKVLPPTSTDITVRFVVHGLLGSAELPDIIRFRQDRALNPKWIDAVFELSGSALDCELSRAWNAACYDGQERADWEAWEPEEERPEPARLPYVMAEADAVGVPIMSTEPQLEEQLARAQERYNAARQAYKAVQQVTLAELEAIDSSMTTQWTIVNSVHTVGAGLLVGMVCATAPPIGIGCGVASLAVGTSATVGDSVAETAQLRDARRVCNTDEINALALADIEAELHGLMSPSSGAEEAASGSEGSGDPQQLDASDGTYNVIQHGSANLDAGPPITHVAVDGASRAAPVALAVAVAAPVCLAGAAVQGGLSLHAWCTDKPLQRAVRQRIAALHE